MIKAANALIVLTEAGELVLIQPNPAAYEEIARHKVLDLYCWNDPVLSHGRIYARRTSASTPEIVAIDVAAENVAPLPPISLDAALMPDRTRIVLTIRALDGSHLNSSHSDLIELQSRTELTEPPSQWSSLNQVFTATGGILVTELPIEGSPVRFLRVRAD